MDSERYESVNGSCHPATAVIHTKPKLINRVGSANEEEELKQRIKGTNKHVGVISYGGYELTHLERS